MENIAIKKLAAEIFCAPLRAVDPYDSVKLYNNKIYSIYKSGIYNRLLVIGFGKAVCLMAKAMAIEDSLVD